MKRNRNGNAANLESARKAVRLGRAQESKKPPRVPTPVGKLVFGVPGRMGTFIHPNGGGAGRPGCSRPT